MKIFLWSIIQRAMSLGENLQQRNITSGTLCNRCNEMETAMHTFFQCSFAQEVWNHVPLKQVVHLARKKGFKEAMVQTSDMSPTNRNHKYNTPIDLLGTLNCSKSNYFWKQNFLTRRNRYERGKIGKIMDLRKGVSSNENRNFTSSGKEPAKFDWWSYGYDL